MNSKKSVTDLGKHKSRKVPGADFVLIHSHLEEKVSDSKYKQFKISEYAVYFPHLFLRH